MLLLSAYTETSLAARLLEIDSAGIGYLLKDRVTDVGSLIDALQRLAAGETVIDSGIAPRSVEAPIAEIFRTLNIQPGPDDNRRVKAVLAWLRAHQDSGG